MRVTASQGQGSGRARGGPVGIWILKVVRLQRCKIKKNWKILVNILTRRNIFLIGSEMTHDYLARFDPPSVIFRLFHPIRIKLYTWFEYIHISLFNPNNLRTCRKKLELGKPSWFLPLPLFLTIIRIQSTWDGVTPYNDSDRLCDSPPCHSSNHNIIPRYFVIKVRRNI